MKHKHKKTHKQNKTQNTSYLHTVKKKKKRKCVKLDIWANLTFSEQEMPQHYLDLQFQAKTEMIRSNKSNSANGWKVLSVFVCELFLPCRNRRDNSQWSRIPSPSSQISPITQKEMDHKMLYVTVVFYTCCLGFRHNRDYRLPMFFWKALLCTKGSFLFFLWPYSADSHKKLCLHWHSPDLRVS